MSTVDKHERVRDLLLSNRGAPGNASDHFWPWMSELDGKPADKQSANKFMLGCIIDYQNFAGRAWDSARRFTEVTLGDPEDLWTPITAVSKSMWTSKKQEYSLHRWDTVHNRVWRIGNEIVRKYQGDSRNIWAGQPAGIVLSRLLEMRVGPEISRMVVGALIDTNQISGTGAVKADSHVRKVLGRVFEGREVSPDEAHRYADAMLPGNSWPLDRPLYSLGKGVCKASSPLCDKCYLSSECEYNRRRRL